MKKLVTVLLALMLSAPVWALPPQIELDRLLLQAKTALDGSDYAVAIDSLEKARALNLKLPETYYFHVGRAYAGAKKWEESRKAYEQYLEQAGAKGKFYKEALEGFNQADAEVAKVEKARAEEWNKYSEAKRKYEENVRNCPEEYKRYRKGYEERKDRLSYECQHYGKYDCGNYRDSKAEALFERWQRAERDLSELPYEGDWCKNRYTAPKLPSR